MDGRLDINADFGGNASGPSVLNIPVVRPAALADKEWEQHADISLLIQQCPRISDFLRGCGVRLVYPFVLDVPERPPILGLQTSRVGALRIQEIFTDASQQVKDLLSPISAIIQEGMNTTGGTIGHAALLMVGIGRIEPFLQTVQNIQIAPSPTPLGIFSREM